MSNIRAVGNYFYKGKQRTADVNTYESGDFASMLLSGDVLRGLQEAGFVKPSPIQYKSIPVARCGLGEQLHAQTIVGGSLLKFGRISPFHKLLRNKSSR